MVIGIIQNPGKRVTPTIEIDDLKGRVIPSRMGNNGLIIIHNMLFGTTEDQIVGAQTNIE